MSPAFAQNQISLNPTNVIGGTTPYSPQFDDSLVLDQQSGDVSEPTQSGYWLNPDNTGSQDAYIVIDLGQAFRIGELQLFNTHNAQFADRGTGDFTITGSNAITPTGRPDAFGMDIDAGTLLLSGTLAPVVQADDPIDAQSFNVTNPGTYRYLRFDAETVASGNAPCCGANAATTSYGLNEIRIFESPVPEPASVGMLGFGSLAWLVRRRRP